MLLLLLKGRGGVVQRPRQSSVGTPRDGCWVGEGRCAAPCQAWEPLCVYRRETVPTQNNERAVALLNKKSHFCSLTPPTPPHLKVMELEIWESTQRPPVCRQSGLARRGAKAEVIINSAVPS